MSDFTAEQPYLVPLRVLPQQLSACIVDVQGPTGCGLAWIWKVIEPGEQNHFTVLVAMDCGYPFLEWEWMTRWDFLTDHNARWSPEAGSRLPPKQKPKGWFRFPWRKKKT